MTARSAAPPGRRSGPVTQPARPYVVEVATTDKAIVDDRGGRGDEAHCWLCPLPRCGYAGCRVDAEQVTA
jgi:hypothetical protein